MCHERPLQGWRDQRTGRVYGFQSEQQRENFMVGRARFSNGPNRQMPRCSADQSTGRAVQSSAHARPVNLLLPQWECCSTDTTDGCRPVRRHGPHPACADAIGPQPAARSLAARSARARSGRSCLSPTMRRPVEHGQRGKVSNLMSSTAIFRRSRCVPVDMGAHVTQA